MGRPIISATSDSMARIPMFDREPRLRYQPPFRNRTTSSSRVCMRAIFRLLSSSSVIECAHPTKCVVNYPIFLSSTACAARCSRNAGMAPNCLLHNQQAVSGWNCHGRCSVSTCTLEHLHCIHSIVEAHTAFSSFLGGAISAVIVAGNCPLPLRRGEVSCCERTGAICGLMSATISHTSSEEAEDGGAEACAPCARLCLFLRRHRLPNTTGGLVSGSQASSTTVVVTGLMSVDVGASPVHMAVVHADCV